MSNFTNAVNVKPGECVWVSLFYDSEEVYVVGEVIRQLEDGRVEICFLQDKTVLQVEQGDIFKKCN